jgi:hypothetical protein
VDQATPGTFDEAVRLAVYRQYANGPPVRVDTAGLLGDGQSDAVVGWVRVGFVRHFLVPMASAWDDVLKTCGNQRILCSAECIHGWLEATGSRLGSTMDLAALWRLAQHWYDGRLDPGYVRREPSQARAYFRETGPAGAFWGLD